MPTTDAPGELDLLRRFVNTADLEGGDDDLDAPAKLREWLKTEGLPDGGADAAAVGRVREVREAIRDLLSLNAGQEPSRPDPAARLATAGAAAALHVRFDAAGTARLEPAGDGVDAALATLLAIVARAQAEGTWPRLKACHADSCRWAFYDHSRNRSRAWCDMAVCGNRAKARAYRARAAGDEG